MSSVVVPGDRLRTADQGLTALPQVGCVRLAWRPQAGMSYEVHARAGSGVDWQPSAATLVGSTTAPRFVHCGLGPRASTWTYRVVAIGEDRRVTPPVTTASLRSVTDSGRPLATVGSFDGTGRGLAIRDAGFVHYRTSFPHDVDFRYGFDRPELHWSFVQPGPEDAWAGRRPHRFRLRFDVDAALTDDVDLAIWLVDRNPSRPGSLTATVNGSRVESMFFDETDAQSSALVRPGAGAGPAYFETVIPRRLLTTGENVLDLGKDHGSWVAYDAVGVFARDSAT